MNPVIWQALEWPAIEYFRLYNSGQGMAAVGCINGVKEKQPFCIRYKVDLTSDWRTSAFHIREESVQAKELHLSSDLEGHWFDKDNNHIALFDNCMDIDISLTPFTNTLPVRRLQFNAHESKVLDMLYIKLPEFELQRVQQRYTRLAQHEYLYENVDNDFSARLPYDEFYIVKDYPGLFERINY
ncbi:hypothetical protein SAMN05660909_01920 [Chitinophaga terrae (ex Kim and Jung 2007)]|jgi:hypothetical protein|uniref:Glycolipid-binding domain-containing protein n=1 Tax=Chitinophaga terrae (ex Kim and Jung 2007) TaxID=408074 RepID=A0A1H4B6A7_9BACT|nr:putative glycolipid-binding domain-containing protein [Chitinophaga terrae (ex Kim and Jung 2007)]MDQ0106342.1 hypothetical protein [Chitinophaga terrae (ex Kim and Jung 2007)]GEP91192.1 transcriptional regulator [Chitinophaga terrae (ex Kim and Jung 2007)]SEA43815.1 hypothetical protein SAMN05660909_01920 [Chitinophaga terrae (ex Kim and Jung 2007)]